MEKTARTAALADQAIRIAGELGFELKDASTGGASTRTRSPGWASPPRWSRADRRGRSTPRASGSTWRAFRSGSPCSLRSSPTSDRRGVARPCTLRGIEAATSRYRASHDRANGRRVLRAGFGVLAGEPRDDRALRWRPGAVDACGASAGHRGSAPDRLLRARRVEAAGANAAAPIHDHVRHTRRSRDGRSAGPAGARHGPRYRRGHRPALRRPRPGPAALGARVPGRFVVAVRTPHGGTTGRRRTRALPSRTDDPGRAARPGAIADPRHGRPSSARTSTRWSPAACCAWGPKRGRWPT